MKRESLREIIKTLYHSWKFDKKMCVFFSVAIILSMTLIMSLSLFFSVRSIISSSQRLVEEKVGTMVHNTEYNFEQYQGILWTLMVDSDVQEYLQSEEVYGHYAPMQKTLENAYIMWENMNFIGIISEDGKKKYIKGSATNNSEVGIQNQLMEDMNTSLRFSRKSTSMKTMTYNTAFSRTGKYALMIYQPVFSNNQLNKFIGTLYLNIDDPQLGQLIADADNNLDTVNYFLYSDGTVISCSHKDKIGTKMNVSAIRGEQGCYWKNGKLNVYKKLKDWNYMYMTNISLYAMCRDNLFSIVVLVIVVLIWVGLILKIASHMIHIAYKPWENVAETIDTVSKGVLSARLDETKRDPDMARITVGFNVMMEKILELMQQVKEEQKQADQMRFNALQSQIQPHFLYNTLDCIHWQAVMDGNTEISNMVKALAAYYRICLSKGRDVISLDEEMNHIKNYLYIQQMRYGDVLTYEISDPGSVGRVKIPKLTLQPLVENSIYHGIKIKDGKYGHVEITVGTRGENVIITVCDSGQGMTEEEIKHMNRHISEYDETMGYGVRNVNRRIELLYGIDYGLHYQANESGGVTVEVMIPKENSVKSKEDRQDV